MFFALRRPLILFLVVLSLPLKSDAGAPANVAEFGVVSLDISGAKAFSSFISERKTLEKIYKATANGVLRFRSGASGIYRVRTVADGRTRDEEGRFETTVSIQIPRPEGLLRFTGIGRRRWSVPAQVPMLWPRHENAFEPVFRGPNAEKERREWRDRKAQRDAEIADDQKQARENYRIQAIKIAFADSLQDARHQAENQLQKALQPNSLIAEFGEIELDVSRFSALAGDIQPKAALEKLKNRPKTDVLRFRQGASGFYQIIVSGQGDRDNGSVKVEVVIGVEGRNGPIRVRAAQSEVWPIPPSPLAFEPPPEDIRLYPPVTSRYRPKDKNGKEISPSYQEKKAAEELEARRLPRKRSVRDAFETAIEGAQRDAETKLRAALQSARPLEKAPTPVPSGPNPFLKQ